MWVKIMLWAMLIGSIIMGYLGIRSGSTTNAVIGVVVFLLIGFLIYFLFTLLFRFGLIVVKFLVLALIMSAVVLLSIRGCQFLIDKGKEVSTTAIEKTHTIEEKIKTQSLWDKISSKTASLFSSSERSDTNDGVPAPQSQHHIMTALPEKIQGHVNTVYSGYMFNLNGHYIKLYGIDAPDTTQKCYDKRGENYDCGHESKKRLERLILNQPLQCQIAGGDYYENYIATCTIKGVDVGVGMVSTGWALADRNVTTVYIPYEESAHQKHLGLWAGKFIAPWQVRAVRSPSKSTSPKNTNFFSKWF